MVIGSEILSEKQMILIGILVVIFVVFAVLVNLLDNKSLNGIKAKKIGDGQHGTARWATRSEIKRTFIPLPFEPEKWRKGENLPAVQGTVIGQDRLLFVSEYRACLCFGNVVCQYRHKGRCGEKLRNYRQKVLRLQCFCA